MFQPLPKHRALEPLDLLVRAFDEDPFFRFLAPERESRAMFVREVMRSNIEVGVGRGWVRVVENEELRGTCIWIPPDEYPPGLPMVRARAAAVGRALVEWARQGRAQFHGLFTALRIAELMDESHPDGRYYYLQVLAVDPKFQGQKVGSGILSAILAEADRDRLPAALETAREANVRLYRRHGFEITHTLRIGSSPPMWIMRRDPL